MLSPKLAGALDRELHTVLTGIGMLEQRTDEFVEQEALVRRFEAAWRRVIEGIEDSVMAQLDAGKRKVKVL